MNFENLQSIPAENTERNEDESPIPIAVARMKKKQLTKVARHPSVMAKVIGEFGLKVENQRILPQEEIEDRRQRALQGWRKVRNALGALRKNKNAGFLYSSKMDDRKWKLFTYQNCLIYPQSSLKSFLVILKAAITLWNILVVPFRYAFDKVSENDLILCDMVADCFFVFIIISHFFYVTQNKSHYMVEFRKIALKYLFSIFEGEGQFIIDIVGSYPYYWHQDNQLYLLRFVRFAQMGAMVQGYTLFWRKVIRVFTSNINFTKSLTDILKFLLMLFVIAQCLACWWFNIGKSQRVLEGFDSTLDQPVYKDGWVYNLLLVNDPKATMQSEYITSLYWVFTTLTTLGYGDYYGTTTQEYIFTMFVEFLGVFVFAYMMGNINVLVEKLDDDHLEYLQIENEKLDQWLIMITRANDTRRFTENFVDELRHRLNIYWQRDHSSVSKDFPFYKQLPCKLQQDLVDEIFGKFLSHFGVFFKGLDGQFIQAVVTSLYPKQFLVRQGDVDIITADTCPSEVYFITKGRVAISTKAGDKYLILPSRSYFGDHLILFKIRSSNTYTTYGEDVECMCVSRERFLQLCEVYPYSMKILKYRAFLRRRFFQEVKSKREEIRRQNRKLFYQNQGRYFEDLNGRKPSSPKAEVDDNKHEDKVIETYEIQPQDLVMKAKAIADDIKGIKDHLTTIEQTMKSKMEQVKIEIEFITKYEEILQNFEDNE